MFFSVVLLLVLLQFTASFRPTFTSSRSCVRGLKMMADDPIDAIRAKMASDPNYDPLKDPDALRIIESKIPSELRDVSNAFSRLEVSFKDATTGTDAVDDLDARAVDFPNKAELISSPQSKWFKNSMPAEDAAFSSKKKDELFEKLKKAYPEVPL